MDKDFLEWWELRKHEMFYDDNMGVREIAAAAYKAGRESAQHTLAVDGAEVCRVERHVFIDGVCTRCGIVSVSLTTKA